MRLTEIAEKLDLSVVCDGGSLDREISGGYASDLMSDVIAHVRPGDVWVTLQVHMNVVAVAAMKEIGAIVLTHGRTPLADTVTKAQDEGVPILVSSLPAFEVVGRLYELGIRGV